MRCSHVKDSGEQCGMKGNLRETEDGALCIWHDPTRRRKAQRMRAKGAKAVAEKKRRAKIRTVEMTEALEPPQDIEDVARWLSWTAVAVSTGKVDARTAREVTYALRALLDALERVEQSEQIEELRAQLEALTGGDAA